jgi:hypothetical protein
MMMTYQNHKTIATMKTRMELAHSPVIVSNCGNNSVQTNSLISLPNSQLAMLLGSMSHVFIEGGSAGQALFHVRVAVMG